MQDTEYAYAVAYIKTLENKMLTPSDIDSLINAESFSQCLSLLSSKGYPEGTDIDEITEKELEKAWDEVLDCTPDGAPLDILKYKNDFHNLKTILKAFIVNADWESLILSPSVEDPQKIYEAVKTANFSELDGFLRDAAKGAYEIITKENDGQKAEIYIDKKSFEAIKNACRGNEFLEEWAETNIVLTDFLIALRAYGKSREFIRDAFLQTDKINLDILASSAESGIDAVGEFIAKNGYAEGAEALKNSLGEFEKWCENKKTELLKTQKHHFFGFEPIMAFLLGKENEVQAVRIILTAHKNNIPKSIIKERIGELYV